MVSRDYSLILPVDTDVVTLAATLVHEWCEMLENNGLCAFDTGTTFGNMVAHQIAKGLVFERLKALFMFHSITVCDRFLYLQVLER